MERYCLFIVLLIFALFSKLHSQEIWEPTNGPFGGKVNSVAEISNDNMIAATEHGVFITTDAGENWNVAGLSSSSIRRVSANSFGVIFAGIYGSGGVYRSTNNGEDWIQSGLVDEGVWSLSIDYNNNIYAGLGNYYPETGGLYRSTDNGLSWSFLGFLNSSVRDVAVNQDGDIFAATYDGVFRSSDNGLSWLEILEINLTNSIKIKFDGKIFISNGFDYVYRSTDNGNTWEQLNQGFDLYNPQLLSIHSDETIFALTEYYNWFSGFRGIQVFHSTNDGDNWEKMSQNDLEVQVNSFLINSNGKTFLGTYWDGVFRSNDLGINWLKKNNGLSNILVNTLEINTNGKLFAGTTGSSLFYSTNNGEQWENIRVSLNSRYVYDLILSNDQKIIAATNAGVYLSSDDGANWEYKGLQYSGISNFLFNLNEDLFAATYSEGIYFSSDFGDTWSTANTGLTTDNVGTLAINSDQLIFAGTNVGIFRSTNNGESWTLKKYGPTFQVIVTKNDVIFAGTPFGEIYRSTNDGDNWSNKSNGLPGSMIYTIYEVVNAGIFAGTEDGVYFSDNDGDSWSALNTGLTSLKINSFLTDQEEHLFVATAQGVFRSIDKVTSTFYQKEMIPANFKLYQSYPNPFNPSTKISWQIPVGSHQTLKIYDVLGNKVATLVDEYKPGGSYEVEWNASNNPSGVYFYQLRTEGYIETKKMILLR